MPSTVPLPAAGLLARRTWLFPAVIAFLAWLGVLATIDPTGEFPGLFSGPGLTLDEPFNVVQGLSLADRLLALDPAGFRRMDERLPDHPPLGRVWIGLVHELTYVLIQPSRQSSTGAGERAPYSIACARPASATAFAILVFLVGWCAGRWYGPVAGAVASASLVLMPRMFGHAHLAALETFINLSYAGVVLYVADRLGGGDDPRQQNGSNESAAPGTVLRTAAIAGFLLALALLTKIQAALLPLPLIAWCIWRLRRRAAYFLLVAALTSAVVFLMGWPHLWADTLANLRQYMGRTTDRASIMVWYFGEALADRDVPWQYPWVIFAATVPVGLQILGVCGVLMGASPGWKCPRCVLLLACLLFPLFVFSWPGIAVYDGERLFSVVFPLWALLIGRGAQEVFRRLSGKLNSQWSAAVLSVFLAAQSYGLFAVAPCWLSYYNILVGGLGGADRIGLQVTYWGDSLTRDLLRAAAEKLPQNATVHAAPVLYEFQWNEVLAQNPELTGKQIRLMPIDHDEGAPAEFILLFLRKEYLPPELRHPGSDYEVVAEIRRSGVRLAALLRRR